jgi:spore coat polysaccharide biosynthesis protein SpsF
MSRTIASIEARMGASRLPGKVLLELAGRPALGRMIVRVRRSKSLDGIIIATTTNPTDDAIARWAETEGVAAFRGSEDDVLDRVLKAQQMMKSDIVVELCGDCPLIDPAVVDAAVMRYRCGDCDIVTTTAPQSYPQGIDVEVFSLDALRTVAAQCHDPEVREHVSLDFYRNSRWRLVGLEAPAALRRPDVRLLLDWPEDAAFLSALSARLDALHGPEFGTAEVLALLGREGARLGQPAAAKACLA